MPNVSKQNIALSRKKDYLVITHTTFSPMGFALESKRGIAQIAEGFNPEEVLENANKVEWELQGEPDRSGFYKAVATDVEAES